MMRLGGRTPILDDSLSWDFRGEEMAASWMPGRRPCAHLQDGRYPRLMVHVCGVHQVAVREERHTEESWVGLGTGSAIEPVVFGICHEDGESARALPEPPRGLARRSSYPFAVISPSCAWCDQSISSL